MTIINIKPVPRKSNLLQYLAMLSGCLAGSISGINLGWPSPYLPYLQNKEISHIPITTNEGSWCAVMPLLGAPPGAFLAAMIIDIYGRKNLLLTIAPLVSMCFILLAFADNIYELCILRLIIGATEGATFATLPIYLAEIADPKIRGKLGASTAVASLTGTIFINVIGPWTTIFTSSIIFSCIPILHMLTFVWMPESPYYLLKKSDFVGARKSLVALRGTSDVMNELDTIGEAVKRQELCKKAKFSDLITVKSNRRALIIYFILCYTNKFSGKNPMTFYTTMIFEMANGSLDTITSVVIFSVAGLISTIAAMTVIDRFGRRPLMLFSSVGCSLALCAEGSYFTIQKYLPSILPSIGWLPVTALIIYNLIFSFGLTFGPVLFLSELFPTTVKGRAMCIGELTSVIMATCVSKFFQVVSDSFGIHVPFWTFAGCGLLGFILIYLYVPETKGKTLDEIQLELIGEPSVQTQVKSVKC